MNDPKPETATEGHPSASLSGYSRIDTLMRRAVTHLAGQAGIRQFLDIGTGIPTGPNTHELAQSIAPGFRADRGAPGFPLIRGYYAGES